MHSARRTKRWCILLLLLAPLTAQAAGEDAKAIVKAAIDYWRDVSSYTVADMTIRRPDWERSVSMRIWTRGEKESLVRVTAPAKDAGNGTLLIKKEMWSYNPKINRVIKIPSSLMTQNWMGSDFSNNDLAKADDLITQYTHKLLQTTRQDGHALYVIESTPLETAPVVWGREVVTVRDDYVVLGHDYYDQQGVLVKQLKTLELKPMGGKVVATQQRMQNMDKPGEWTDVTVIEARFGVSLPASMFTLSNLRNPRDG